MTKLIPSKRFGRTCRTSNGSFFFLSTTTRIANNNNNNNGSRLLLTTKSHHEEGAKDSNRSSDSSSTSRRSTIPPPPPIPQPIVGYHVDEFKDWVAELQCGHYQHVRHNPPMIERPWVLTEEGRNQFLGHPLLCKKCAQGAPRDDDDDDDDD